MRHQQLICILVLVVISTLRISAINDIPGLPATINNGKPVNLVVWGLPSMSDVLKIDQKATLEVANAFMQQYPNVHLEPFTFINVPTGGDSSMKQDTDILMSMAAGTAPDVLTVNFRQSDTFIRQGFLLPLDKYFAQWQSSPGGRAEANHLLPTKEVWNVIRRIGPDGKSHIWALPPNLLVTVLQYRKDLFRGAGLDPEKPPKTWDELYQMCLATCNPAKGIYAYPPITSYGMTWMIWSAGSDVLAPNTDNPDLWHAAYDDAHACEAYAYAWKLANGPWGDCPDCHDHFAIAPGAAQATCPYCHHTYSQSQLMEKKAFFQGVCAPSGSTIDYWGQGQQAFATTYMGDLQLSSGGIDPAVTGMANVPAGAGGLSSAEINASMLAISGTVKDPAKQDAAWAYIRFRASELAHRITTRVYVEGGYAKFLNPSWLAKFGYQSMVSDVPAGWAEIYASALKNGHPEPYGTNAQHIYNEMDTTLGNVMLLKTPGQAQIQQILHTGVTHTNEILIGTVAPAEKRRRDLVAWIVVLGSLILFVFLGKYTLNAYGQALATPEQVTKASTRRLLIALLTLLPAVAAIVLFQYYPLARGSIIAFKDYHLLTASPWVGVSNFGQVLFSADFWKALLRSLEFAVISMALGFFAPIMLALLLHEIPRGSLFFRIVYFLPSVTTGIVVMLLWKQFYDPSAYGMLNQILGFFHLPLQTFLQDPNLVMVWVVLPSVWMGLGPGCIIYLACLRQIPGEYYEAADVDGAGFWTKVWAITVPFMKPLLIINFVGACIGSLKSFEQVMVMTGGGPAGSSRVLGLEIWQNSFMYLRYGYGTAMGWILASLLIGFTIFQLRYLSKVQFRLAKSE